VILAVLSLAAFMASLDLFIVNVAFDEIGRDFAGSSLASLSWVLNGYAIVYAALLVPLGRIADRFGPKRGFLIGLSLFTLASGACAASPSLAWLVAFRVLQAAGAALLTPTSMALLLRTTPPEQRPRAVRIWAATGALAAAAGPAIGGLLVQASWRWVFSVNLPMGLATLLLAARIVPESRSEKREALPDLLGSVLLALGISAVSLALVKAPEWGYASISTAAAALLACAALAWFVQRSRRHASPVVEPALLRVPAFLWSNLTAVWFSIGFAANLLTTILWLQQVWHYSALRTGLALAPGPMMVPVFAAVGQRLARRLPAGVIAAAGCALCAVGALYLRSSVGAEPAYLTSILPGWMIGGAGVGLAMPTMLSSATVDLPRERAATGSAIVNMGRQVGSVLGVSLLVALLGHPHGFEQAHAAFTRAWAMVACASLVGVFAALKMTPRLRSATSAEPAPLIELKSRS
jgi:EmrB/QacA subfamily drug resistance transporter